jgi:Uma2 family endonuclease
MFKQLMRSGPSEVAATFQTWNERTPTMSYVTAESRVEWLPHGRAFTRADLDAMPDDGNRYEIIDGTLIVTPAPSMRHQATVVALVARLAHLCPPQLRLLVAPFDVDLAPKTVVQPDVLIAERSRLTERDLKGPPVLAVEVISPSTRHIDLALKRARYEEAGCPSYWVIDPAEPSIVCWELRDGRYVEEARATASQSVTLAAPFSVTLAPAELID